MLVGVLESRKRGVSDRSITAVSALSLSLSTLDQSVTLAALAEYSSTYAHWGIIK